MVQRDPVDSEALRLQMQQAIEHFRHQQTFLIQEVGFLIAADTLLLVYDL